MGHEGTGVVYKLGKGVTTDSAGVPIKEGDRVIHSLGTHCGSCRMCLNGEANLCIGQRGAPPGVGEWPYFVGTYADYFYVHPQRSLYRVPDEIDDEVLGPPSTAPWGRRRRASSRAGSDTVPPWSSRAPADSASPPSPWPRTWAPTTSSSSTAWRTASNSARSSAPTTPSTSRSSTPPRRACSGSRT